MQSCFRDWRLRLAVCWKIWRFRRLIRPLPEEEQRQAIAKLTGSLITHLSNPAKQIECQQRLEQARKHLEIQPESEVTNGLTGCEKHAENMTKSEKNK